MVEVGGDEIDDKEPDAVGEDEENDSDEEQGKVEKDEFIGEGASLDVSETKGENRNPISKREPIVFVGEEDAKKMGTRKKVMRPIPRKPVDIDKIFAEVTKKEKAPPRRKSESKSKARIVEEVFKNLRRLPESLPEENKHDRHPDDNSDELSGSEVSFDLANFYSSDSADEHKTTMEINLKYTDKLLSRTYPSIWPS